MREIKFRAWDKTEKVMLHWDFIEDDMLPTVLSYGDFIPMQYTGLHDKNGKEIYEGDVVLYSSEWGNCEVVWKYGGFGLEVNGVGGFTDGFHSFSTVSAGQKDCEVIGNIYENPELLNPHTT